MGPGASGQRKLPDEVLPLLINGSEVEIWKRISDAELYFVSSFGRIFSQRTNKLLRPSSQERYNIVSIAGKSRRVCRLVAEAFVPGRTEERWQVNHKDGKKINDKASNLEWVSPKENIIHAVKMGLSSYRKAAVDTSTIEEVYKDVLWLCKSPYSSELTKKYGLSAPVMNAIVEGVHYLQQEGKIERPTNWLLRNPPPANCVSGPEATLTAEELAGWFAAFKNGSNAEAIAKRAKAGVGASLVSAALAGGLVRQRRGELPLPPADLQESRRAVPPTMADASVIAEVIRLRTEEKMDLGSIADRLSVSHDLVKRINQNRHFLQVGGDAPLMPKLRKREIPSKQKVTPEVVSRILANAAAGMGLNANCRAVGLGPPTVKKVLRGQHPVQLLGSVDAKA